MIVIVHGYDGSGPGHWQHWLASELAERGVAHAFPQLSDPLDPVCDVWVDELAAIVASSATPVTFVAHSLGCWAVDHLLARRADVVPHAALLVAPPSPYSLFEPIQSFLPPPRKKAAWAPLAERTLVIGSDDDDYASEDEFVELAERLGARCEILPGKGHLNAASGFGPFPRVVDWLESVAALGR